MNCYEALRNTLRKSKPSGRVNAFESLTMGMASGAAAQFVASPGDLAKVQMQTEGRMRTMGFAPRGNSVLDIWRAEVKRGGVRALWKGIYCKSNFPYLRKQKTEGSIFGLA